MTKTYSSNAQIHAALKAFQAARGLRSEGEAVRLAIALTTTLTGLPTPDHSMRIGRPVPETANDRRKRFDIMLLPLELRPAFVPWLNQGIPPSDEAFAAATAAGVSVEALMAANFWGDK